MKIDCRPFHSRAKAGLTLFEVIIAMIVISLLTGTVFAIVASAVRATSEVETINKEADEVHAFASLLRKTFTSLPSDARVRININDEGPPLLQTLRLDDVPTAFSFGSKPASYEKLRIGMVIQSDEPSEDGSLLYTVGVTRTDILSDGVESGIVVTDDDEVLLAPDENGRYWLPLIRNVTSLTWRVYLEDKKEWTEEWQEKEFPDLIEMTLLKAGSSLPFRVVFAPAEGGGEEG